MKTMRKLLCLLLVLCTCAATVLPAVAVESNPSEDSGLLPADTKENPGNTVTAQLTGCNGKDNESYNAELAADAETYDADYPLIVPKVTETNFTIPKGEIGKLTFLMMHVYKNERYYINIYDKYGDKVASAYDQMYNTSLLSNLTITVDSSEDYLPVGEYTVEYYMAWYTYGSWYKLKETDTFQLTILENKCYGNHNYKQTRVITDATCEDTGCIEETCSRCGNRIYKETPATDEHTWDEGTVTVEPTGDTAGTRTYTCTVCGTTVDTNIPPLETAPEKPYKIANVVSGVHVYWNGVEGVQKYGLWRSETGKNGEYKWIANPTVAHFTDTKVESGKTYFYKVTYLNTDYNIHTNKSEPIGVTYVSTPDITSRFNKAAGITVGWNKVSGATGYAIYRKSYFGSDAWVRVGTIEGNSTFTWQDTSVKDANGKVYKYTVRALAGSDMKTLSGCRNAGRTMARLTSRTLNSAAKASATSIKCSWSTSSAVTGYEVRFMVGDQVYKTFTVGNYKTGVKTFTGLETGKTYKIQVRSYLKVDGMGFYSAWSTAKKVAL